jgi:hypothetical protein
MICDGRMQKLYKNKQNSLCLSTSILICFFKDTESPSYYNGSPIYAPYALGYVCINTCLVEFLIGYENFTNTYIPKIKKGTQILNTAAVSVIQTYNQYHDTTIKRQRKRTCLSVKHNFSCFFLYYLILRMLWMIFLAQE